jgi:D-amino-acid dehydrogenase
MMPNMMPKVGQGRMSRVFYNTGHGHLGWTLSAITAEMVSEVVRGSPSINGERTHTFSTVFNMSAKAN